MTKTYIIGTELLDGLAELSLDRSILNTRSVLEEVATDGSLSAIAPMAFGDLFNQVSLENFRQQWQSRDFDSLPTIEIRSAAELNGANGAYSAATNRIYLSQEYITQNTSNPQVITDVLLEEVGHFVDSQINVSDSPGDEGAIFANLVQGVELDEQELQALKAEDDTSEIILDGQIISIEMADPGNTIRTAEIQNSLAFTRTERVSQSDSSDFYRITVNNSGIFTANLSGLTGDADVRLILDRNKNGRLDQFENEILAWQWEREAKNESIRSFLDPGKYFVQVMSYNNRLANYKLSTHFEAATNDPWNFAITATTDQSLINAIATTFAGQGMQVIQQAQQTIEQAIRNASQVWENVIPYSSREDQRNLPITVRAEVMQNDNTLATGGGRTLTFNTTHLMQFANNVNGFTDGVALHEIGHILGLVDFDNKFVGSRDSESKSDERAESAGNFNFGVYKARSYAGWSYGELLGTFDQTAVPVTIGKGGGSDYTHWRESVFNNELMTHQDDNPAILSQLTISALRDSGWDVNYGAAQNYSLPPQNKVELGITINRVEVIHKGSFDSDKIDPNEPADLYTIVNIDDATWTTFDIGNKDIINPNWSFSRLVGYIPNADITTISQAPIAITIGIYDEDDKVITEESGRDDIADINPDPNLRNLYLVYDISTRDFISVKKGQAPQRGNFTNTGFDISPLGNGQFQAKGEDGGKQVEILFTLNQPLASISPDGILRLIITDKDNNVVIKHISGQAGNEVIEITSNGITQQFGTGTSLGSFNRIEGLGSDIDNTITLDGVLTTADLQGGNGNDRLEIINSPVGITQGSTLLGGAGNDTLQGGLEMTGFRILMEEIDLLGERVMTTLRVAVIMTRLKMVLVMIP